MEAVTSPLSLFDLHCDTALEMYRAKSSFSRNNCAINAQLLKSYRRTAQVMAVYCPEALSDDEGFLQCFSVLSHLHTCLGNRAEIIRSRKEIPGILAGRKTALIPAVEDARILAGSLSRLAALYRAGIRILTLLWGGNTCIGGSHDTDSGLTPFGRAVVRKCHQIGIIPDISHASVASAEEIIEISLSTGKPCIASHSDSYHVFPHTRNLSDRHFRAVRDLGGVVGLCLCPAHLGSNSYEAVLAHADHYLSLGGENTLCLGCDMDGTDLPDGIRNVSDLSRIANLFARHGYSDRLIGHIFWENAFSFFTGLSG